MTSSPTSYRVLSRPENRDTVNFKEVHEIGAKVLHILNQSNIRAAIKEENQLGASSARIQEAVLADLERLGFTSEKKGLFSDYLVSGVRPDYYKPLEGGGILFEVERGKSLANNMDLLDVWKAHICKEAQHLFLMVPKIRVNGQGHEQKIFAPVVNRIESFFGPVILPIDVASVHIFGY